MTDDDDNRRRGWDDVYYGALFWRSLVTEFDRSPSLPGPFPASHPPLPATTETRPSFKLLASRSNP
jgi:hypothetical protein